MKRAAILMFLAACGTGSMGDDGDDTVDRPTVYGGDRPVELQTPTGFDETQEYPLVILLHGYSASGLLQSAYLGLADLPDMGVFYMTPDGTQDSSGNRFWNASDACCAANAIGEPPDDVAYIGGLIDDVSADWPVDPARVYLIGHSNGAFMAYRMACERADVVTGIAGLAGGATVIDGWTCDPSTSVSILHVHGDLDTTVPYDGGTLEAPYPGAVASVTEWAERDGCDPTLTDGDALDLERTIDGAETTTKTAGCDAPLGVALWTMVGAGHIPNVQPTFGATVMDWLLAHAR